MLFLSPMLRPINGLMSPFLVTSTMSGFGVEEVETARVWSVIYSVPLIIVRSSSSQCHVFQQLLAILNAVDKLIEQGYSPERTVLLSFGFDEELGGPKVSLFD